MVLTCILAHGSSLFLDATDIRTRGFTPPHPPACQLHRACTRPRGSSLDLPKPIPTRRALKQNASLYLPPTVFPHCPSKVSASQLFGPSTSRIRSFHEDDAKSYGAAKDISDEQDSGVGELLVEENNNSSGVGSSFLLVLALAVGVAAALTIASVGLNRRSAGSFFGVLCLAEGSQSSALAAPPVGFTFKAFGYRIILPEHPPGWIYFWLLMAAGCGLFISEEALNVWVGITLSRTLSLNGTWQSLVESFSRNAPYIMSTVLWVYWGVCISDMIPYYLGKVFRQSGASDDVCSKLGIGEEKVKRITGIVQKYGNLIGFVERFSLGVRNPTAFLAGALGISPECFFGGVCLGGLITLPLQLGIGFLMRESPVFALATVATIVGIWTLFPYAIAASTVLFLYLRGRYST